MGSAIHKISEAIASEKSLCKYQDSSSRSRPAVNVSFEAKPQVRWGRGRSTTPVTQGERVPLEPSNNAGKT